MSKQFQMIPEDVTKIERDLRFHPIVNPNPEVLSQEQILHFNEKGYIKGIRVMTEDEIAPHRAYFDRVLEEITAAGKSSYSVSTAHLKYAGAYDLITHPGVVAIARDLLGENVVAWGCHYFCKMPGDGKRVSWHQDASYWPLTPSKTATVWLAIDDADTENSCMRFIPGSHRSGHLEYHESEASESNVLNQTVPNAEELGDPVDVELQAGQVSVHSDLLLHGSEPNNSSRRRCGITLRYSSMDVRAYQNWNEKGVWVSGRDRTGHWANNPRSAAENE